MRWLQKTAFIALMVGIFFVAFNIDIKPKRNQFKLCRPTEVSKVSIKQGSLDYAIVKNDKHLNWQVEYAGDKTMADDKTVETFLTLACYLPYREEFPLMTDSGSLKLADYGLAPPSISLTVFTETEKTVTEYFGNPTPTGTEYYYVNSLEKGKIYTIPNLFFTGLVVKPFDFKNRTLLANLDHDVGRIVISFAQTQLELKKNDKSWQESHGLISGQMAHDLIKSLNSFNFKKYHGPLTEQDIAYFGLDDPDVVIELTRTNPSYHIERYTLNSIGQYYYLSVSFGGQTYLPILDSRSPKELFKILTTIALKLPSS